MVLYFNPRTREGCDEELKGFIKGNILKYRLRMGHKDDIQKELDKIRVYEQWLVKLERGEALTDAD